LNAKENAMSDEQQLRDLLVLATELPDDVRPPVQRLLRRARGRRVRRMRVGAFAAGLVVLLAVTVPLVAENLVTAGVSASGSGGSIVPPGGQLPPASGPTAAQLAKFRWSVLPSSPLSTLQPDLVTWAGRYLLAVGGAVHGQPSKTGAAFDPVTDQWHLMAPVPFDVNVAYASSVWTGRQLFVTDFRFPRCRAVTSSVCKPHAGLYDPVTNRWTTTQLPRSLFKFGLMNVTWTGTNVVLAGVNPQRRLEVAAYNPAANTWRVITPSLPADEAPTAATVATVPNRLLVWVAWVRDHSVKIHSGVEVLSLGTNGIWQVVTGSWPQHESLATPVLTSKGLLYSPGGIWCQDPCLAVSALSYGGPIRSLPGYFVAPLTWQHTTVPDDPLGSLPGFVWTGRAILRLNDGNSFRARSGQRIARYATFLYDPATGHWRQLPPMPAPTYLAAAPVWTGTELLGLTYHGHLLALHS
jgi:hypothetical protein